MNPLRAKYLITGLVTALLLAGGSFVNPVLADHSSQRHGQQQRYFQHIQRHHNSNHSGWRLSIHNGHNRNRSYSRSYGNRGYGNRGHSNRSWGHNRHHGHHKPRYSYRHHRGHNRHHSRHHNRGRVHYRNSDLVGALVGGAIIYHIGKELARH